MSSFIEHFTEFNTGGIIADFEHDCRKLIIHLTNLSPETEVHVDYDSIFHVVVDNCGSSFQLYLRLKYAPAINMVWVHKHSFLLLILDL